MYDVAKFTKPTTANGSGLDRNDRASLDAFRYERACSPMAEIVREYLDGKKDAPHAE